MQGQGWPRLHRTGHPRVPQEERLGVRAAPGGTCVPTLVGLHRQPGRRGCHQKGLREGRSCQWCPSCLVRGEHLRCRLFTADLQFAQQQRWTRVRLPVRPICLTLARASLDVDYIVNHAASDLTNISASWSEPALSGLRGAPGRQPKAPHPGAAPDPGRFAFPPRTSTHTAKRKGCACHSWRCTYAAE